MKIGQNRAGKWVAPHRIWVVALLVAFGIGIFVGERGLTETLADVWTEFVADWQTQSRDETLPVLTIDMSFDSYNALLQQREEALATGIHVAEASDFQPAIIQLDGEMTPIRLRLQQGTAVHLGNDEKWNFDVRTRDDQHLLGMQRFYLIDPADNNWLNEWAMMETLQRDGLLAPRYQFVRLVINGDDRGIYALQEGFGSELMTEQERPLSVIVEFDATRLWQATAVTDDNRAMVTSDPITNLTADDFRFFEVDTFRDATIADNPTLTAYQNEAIGLLHGLQSGELTAVDVFDVENYGRFLAIADLWGATDATNLINLRYYYHPETGKLEPIGFNTNPIPDDLSRRINLDTLYNDPALQAAYLQTLQIMSDSQFLTDLQAQLEPEWQTQAQQLRGEHDVSPVWEALAQRQALLRQSLSPDQPVFAYLGPPELSMQAIIQIDVANVLNVPVEIVGFDVNGQVFLLADPNWVQSDWTDPFMHDLILKPVDDKAHFLQYARFHLPLTALQNEGIDFNDDLIINVVTRLWGLDALQRTPARAGSPSTAVTGGQ